MTKYLLDKLDFECCYLHRNIFMIFCDKCIRKGQLARPEVGKFWLGKFEIIKSPFKLESSDRSWRVFNAVLSNQKFPTSARTFQLNFSNFISNIPTQNFPTSRFSNCPFQLHVSRLFWMLKCEKISKLKMFEGNILMHLILFRANYVLAQIFEPQNHDF